MRIELGDSQVQMEVASAAKGAHRFLVDGAPVAVTEAARRRPWV